MSKIICDICGTAYPETADQCPICGSARQNAADAPANSAPAAKQPTRGGRFSSANVRKRNKASGVKKSEKAGKTTKKPEKKQQDQQKQQESKRGMVAVAWVLLIAVLLVLVYIAIQFVIPMIQAWQKEGGFSGNNGTTAAIATTVPEDTTAPKVDGVPCTGLTISGGDVTFDASGRAWLLEVVAEPADTTDTITFVSADESVAIVSAQGRVTAIGPGQTVITVTCGNVTKQCNVICSFQDETTVPETTVPETTVPEETTMPEETTVSETTEAPTTEPPTEPEETQPTDPPAENFGLFEQDDVTLFEKGETFEFETGDLYLSQINWTSDDPSVATVENGEVTAVGSGTTTIRGEYNGRTDSCIIRCDFEDTDEDTDDDTTEDTDEDHPEWPYLYPNTDVSIAVGENFALTYVNEDGEWPDIDWSSDDSDIAVVDGDWVTGVSYGVTTIRGTYDGTEITCIVRVIL